jgi:putative sigma-54 modulation protein
MRIDVVGRQIEVTDAIRTHAEEKAGKLPTFYDGVQAVRVTLSREDHHTHGRFHAEVVADVQKHADFVSHATHEDLYAAIDEAAKKVSRQLTEFKERLKQSRH